MHRSFSAFLSDLPLASAGPLAAGDIAPLGLTPSWIVLLSAVVLVMYLTMRGKKRRDPLASQPFRTSLVQQRSLERDMQNVIVELSEMTRQMSAQLETRALKLEQLMHDADAKIEALRQAAQQHSASEVKAVEAIAGELQQMSADVASSNVASAEIAQPARPAMRLVSDDTEDRWAEVYRLGDQGLTLPEIARRLARPNGEIELILALRPKNRPQAAESHHPSSNSDVAAAQ